MSQWGCSFLSRQQKLVYWGKNFKRLVMICVQGLPKTFSTDTDVRISVGLKFLWGMIRNKNLKMFFAAVKSRQSCPTLCNSIDGSPPGSPIPGILQARTLFPLFLSAPFCLLVLNKELSQCTFMIQCCHQERAPF